MLCRARDANDARSNRKGASGLAEIYFPIFASQSSASLREKENSEPGMPECAREPSALLTMEKRPWCGPLPTFSNL